MQQKFASPSYSCLSPLGFRLIASWVAVLVLAHFVPFSFAEDVPVVFTVDNTQSQIDIQVSAAGDNDTDSTSVSGTVNSLLTIDASSGTPNITGVEFNGGRIAADDNLSFTLTVLIFFNINITANDIAGFIDTPLPPGPVTSVGTSGNEFSFAGEHHLITFNEGVITATGAASGTIDLATDPTSGSPPPGNDGSIVLTEGSTTGLLTHYTAALNFPLIFSDTFTVEGTDVTISTTGNIVANGAFDLQLPNDLSADFDADGDVDGDDFLAWQAGNGTTSGATLASGDSNGDGIVNAIDFQNWSESYGTSSASLLSTSVPEPSAILLASLLLFSFFYVERAGCCR